MKRLIIALAIAIATGALAGAEGFVSLGGAGALLFDDPPPLQPDLRLRAGLDLFAPLSEEGSLLFSAALYHFFRPIDAHLRYLYAAGCDFTLRHDELFFKAGLLARGEQLYAPAYAVPDRFDNVLELSLSYDLGDTTLFFTPQLCYNQADLVGDNLILRGEAGLTFLLGERSIGTAKLKGALTLVPLHYSVLSGGGELGLSHYPDGPWLFTLAAGAVYQTSDYSETVLTTTMKRLDFVQIYLTAEFTISLGDAATLKLLLPAKLHLKGMPAVREGAFNGESEWTLAAGPEAELTLGLAEKQALLFLLKGEPFFSNSDYYDSGYGELSVSYRLNF